ncbi:DUF4395 domain-containing protein [Draconibacterium sediminis]|uniref:DUF4395 domain-containing protein n=1 Tax=Draconibacterium sediminis TaxID=1544798 RepID=UPI0026F24C61|nr:DUF4395 domain-containing protein [Draconibacterium sediminis]
MKTYAICPISDKKINEGAARLNAVFVTLLLLVFLLTNQWLIPAFLAIDFLMRSGNLSRYSPIGFSSRNIIQILPLGELHINAGPKIFAARIGFIFSLVIFITAISDLLWSSLAVSGILFLFSFLEAVFGICVACKLYPFIYSFIYKVKMK